MSSDGHIFQEMATKCRPLKGEFLPSVKLPLVHSNSLMSTGNVDPFAFQNLFLLKDP